MTNSKRIPGRNDESGRRRRSGRVLTITAGVAIAAGGAVLGGLVFAPEAVERAYGIVKVNAAMAVEGAREQITGDVPTVALGASGDIIDLDRCDGTFTEMTSYEHEGVPSVWAAHNNCGGDVLLGWEVGQQIRFDGEDQVYEIVDIRHTPKVWATTDDLVGLEGDLALQSCFYGEDRMKFIGLRPADD